MAGFGFYDVYALSPTRTIEAVERFLNRFAPQREPSATEYEVPQYADTPAGVFRTAAELVTYCVHHPTESQSLYWRRPNGGNPAHAMAYFTRDGGLILGLSVSENVERWLGELLATTGGAFGWVGFEEPPPDTADEFRAVATGRA